MINPKCFGANWLRQTAEGLAARDVNTFERCVMAVEFVGRLKQEGLEFIFKGGTSLVLILDPIRRFSIDVDILCLEPLERLEEVLEKIAGTGPFTTWEHQVRRDHEAPPTKHFKFHYTSSIDQQAPHIQLDVITAESPYARLESKVIAPDFLEVEEEVSLQIPSASCLLGDKLATFAPATIGYPYEPVSRRTGNPQEPRPIKVVKHLFDLGELVPLASNLGETLATYKSVHSEQLDYREGGWTISETLRDAQDAAFAVAVIGRNEEADRSEFFRKGIRALDSHLFTLPFGFAEARIASGRATLVAELLRLENTEFDLVGFSATGPDIENLRSATLEGPLHPLNPLKRTDPKAFEYYTTVQWLRRASDVE